MDRSIQLSVLGSLCFALAACGAESPQVDTGSGGSPAAEMSTAPLRSRTLAEANVGGTQVRFVAHDTSEGTLLGIEEIGSAYDKSSPVENLLNQKLTLLEVYRALVPNGQAPDELVVAHAEQTAKLGRQDSAVKQSSVDSTTPVEKSIAACEDWVFEPRGAWHEWHYPRSMNWASGNNWLPVSRTSNTDWLYATTAYVALGVCNESSSAMTANIALDNAKDGWAWSYGTAFSLGALKSWRYWNSWVVYGQCTPSGGQCVGDCIVAGSLCVPRSYGTRWAVNGSGTSFHLKTAEDYVIIR